MRRTLSCEPLVLLALMSHASGRRGPRQPLRGRGRPAAAHGPSGRASYTRRASTPPRSSWTRRPRARTGRRWPRRPGSRPPSCWPWRGGATCCASRGSARRWCCCSRRPGCKSTAELAKQDAPALMAAMNTANKTAKITEKPPTEPQVARLDRPGQEAPPGAREQSGLKRNHGEPVGFSGSILLESRARNAPRT